MDEQQQRIVIVSAILPLIYLIPTVIKHFLGDCEESKNSAMFAIGKRLGALISLIAHRNRK